MEMHPNYVLIIVQDEWQAHNTSRKYAICYVNTYVM